MTDKTFNLTVEGKSPDPRFIAKPLYEFKGLAWDGDTPPDTIVLDDGVMLVKIGRYAAPGDRYSYRVATRARLTNGKLVEAPPLVQA